jgi:enterochelin esterase family protein
MKVLLTGSLIVGLATAAVLAQQQPVSPEVSADRRVTFRLLAPQAHEVRLTGEFMQGSKNFEKDANGLWTLTIGPVEPEIYHYNITIDGVRTIDPGNPNVKTGSTPSTITSILEVTAESPAFYDGQAVPHGEIRSHWYASKSLKTLRRLTVYTPPDYDENAQTQYPVVYLFHGANADETAWYRLGRVNLILDNLLAAKKTKPFLIVMPFGYGVPPTQGSDQAQNTTLFSKDLLEDVIPFIQARYRVFTDRDHRAIVGLSMGGGEALSIGLNHLELFSYVAGFSSGLGRASEFPKTYANLIANPGMANKQLRLLWIGCGREDGAFGISKSFSEFLTTNNIKHTFYESSGEHTWMVWRRYMKEISPLLFQ